jgi:hypothetical protein
MCLHLLLVVSSAFSFVQWFQYVFSYIQQFRACLQWWFTKRCNHAPAAEPSLTPSPRPPPAWGSLHKSILLLVFLPTVDASDVTSLLPDLNYILWSLACHSGQLLAFCWSQLNWVLPWIIVILSLIAIPILATAWINKYLYPLVASAARVPARWYFAPILPSIFGIILLSWIQFIEQHQPDPNHLALGRWICTPLYYLLYLEDSSMVPPTLSIAYSTDSFHLTITPIYDCLSYPLSKMAAGYSPRFVAPIAKHMTGADVTIASPFCPRSQSSPLCTSHLSCHQSARCQVLRLWVGHPFGPSLQSKTINAGQGLSSLSSSVAISCTRGCVPTGIISTGTLSSSRL